MKKKNSYRAKNTKTKVKTIPKLIVGKLGMLLVIIIPIAILISYSMNLNFFSITRILSIFVLIISIAAYLKGEIIYSHPDQSHYSGKASNNKTITHKKSNINFSFSLKNGTVQVILTILIILVLTYLLQFLYKAIG
ncbi:MAG TPA: hypothetical protein VIM70_14730 [Clostridium sp.]|uniref:hypothetical protein n=1 Tax=Clostridium sp. TaxID=1506 RepID=UPI002F91D14B